MLSTQQTCIPTSNSAFSVMFFFLALYICQAMSSRTLQEDHDESSTLSLHQGHEQWMLKYGRVYKDNAEKARRFQIYRVNRQFIEDFNESGNRSYILSANAFADQTNEEFLSYRNGLKKPFQPGPSTPFRYGNVTSVPSTMDWRTKGAVTPVKDQGECGEYTVF